MATERYVKRRYPTACDSSCKSIVPTYKHTEIVDDFGASSCLTRDNHLETDARPGSGYSTDLETCSTLRSTYTYKTPSPSTPL